MVDPVQQTIDNIESLHSEVFKGLFLPKKFRKMASGPALTVLLTQYCKYLKEEVKRIRRDNKISVGKE